MASPDSTPDSATNGLNSADHASPVPTGSTSCHVVRIYASPKDGECIADCPTLPGNILAEVLDSVDLFRKPSRWVVRLDSLRRTHQLPGLAVWFTSDQGLPPLPAPIREPFEPLPLFGDNTHCLESLLDDQAVLKPDAAVWLKSGARRERLARLVFGLFAFLGLLWGAWHIRLEMRAGHLSWPIVLVPVVFLALVLMFAAIVHNWWLFPQGVLVRRGLALPTHGLERFTRSDCAVLLVPESSRWTAYVCRGNGIRTAMLRDRECLALLAAWQSPASPPEMSQLTDYA